MVRRSRAIQRDDGSVVVRLWGGKAIWRIVLLAGCALVGGCGDPSAHAPTLRLTLSSEHGGSRSFHRVSRTGLLSDSADRDGRGNGTSQRMIVDKITEDAIWLTIEVTDSSAGDWSRQVQIPYGEKTVFNLPNETTLTASLERHD